MTRTSDPTKQARDAAKGVADSEPIGWLARVGLAARGTIYLIIGILAFLLAQGSSGGHVDQKGAIEELVSHSYGTALVVLMIIGFVGYALWRLLEAATSVTGEGDGAGARVKSAARGVAYLVLAFTALSTLRGSTQSQSGQQSSLTQRALEMTGGRFLVAIVGLVVLGAGVAMIVEGWKLKFMRYFKAVPPQVHRIVVHLGRVGTIGRGAVFSLIGILLLVAAWRVDASKGGGMDTAFRTLLSQPYGQVLGVVAALALIAFGVYGWAEARWRRV